MSFTNMRHLAADSGNEEAVRPQLRRRIQAVLALSAAATACVPGLAGADSQSTADATYQVANTNETLLDLDKRLGLRGWNIPFFSYANTLTQNNDGFRTDLAKHGIGVLAEDIFSYANNVLDTPRSNPAGQQSYWGQKASGQSALNMFLVYDLGQYGIPDGQFQLGGNITNSTLQSYAPNQYALYRFAYYQSAFNHLFEFSVGYMSNALTFVGVYVGGQLQNPFGPSSTIPIELGLSGSVAVAPTAWLKTNITSHFYNQFGAQRSISPKSGAVTQDHFANSSMLRFEEKGTRALYIDEIGYKRAASAGQPYTWLRAGGIYNTTRYHNYETKGTSNNDGFYALADRQVLQFSSETPRRGLYLGASAMWGKPQTNLYSQYYEARLYGFGLIKSRPKDMTSVVFQRNIISHYFSDPINDTSDTTGTFAQNYANTITGSYAYQLAPGLSFTAGLQYTDHPSATYFKGEGSALNVLAALFVAI
ncbi:MAG: carbohydrate porin [Nevskia sp.]|nr:carbohydrate porin [Nevskia sp.]